MLPTLNNRLSTSDCLAVSREEAARQCRIDSAELLDSDINSMLDTAILAAQAYLEVNYSVSFGLSDYNAVFDVDSYTSRLHLPISEVDTITSITTDSGKVLSYKEYKSNTHCFIDLDNSISRNNKVIVNYKAGFKTAALVPIAVKTAVLMLTAYYYDQRNPETSNSVNISNFAVDVLMLNYKKANI